MTTTNTKTKKVVLLYLLFFSASVLLESCCKQKYKLTSVTEFYAVNSTNPYPNQHEAIEIIRNDFTFVVSFEKQLAGLNFRITNTATALTCSPNLVNKVLQESIQLVCNKSFVYDGDTVQERTNLLGLQGIDLTFDEGYNHTTPELYIYFTPDFITKASFEDSLYKFQLSMPTDDGLVFENEKELLMLVN